MTVRIPRTGRELQAGARKNQETSEDSVRDWETFLAVYEDLRRAARRRIRSTTDQVSLGATGLVHEVLLRLINDPKFDPNAEKSFVFASSLRSMREILIDRSRARHSLKRGGGMQRVGIDQVMANFVNGSFDMSEVHQALNRLEELDSRKAAIVTMRYFLRMTNCEVAALLDISESLVEKELRVARAWLRRELKEFEPEATPRNDQIGPTKGRKRRDDEPPLDPDQRDVRSSDRIA